MARKLEAEEDAVVAGGWDMETQQQEIEMR